MSSHINFQLIEGKLDSIRYDFLNAKPFPFVVIDGFLNHESLDLLIDEIPPPDLTKKSSDYVFAKNKYENPTFGEVGKVMPELKAELLGDRFASIIQFVYGKKIFVDPTFLGGGVHQGGKNSFLDMHADFSRHAAHKDWLRELNILLYLNKNYEDSWGGQLELVNSETRERGSIAPVANRLVLMLTKGHTLHGYKPINFPEGTFRTSIAGYAYSVDTDFESSPERSTVWKPENASFGKNMVAKFSPSLVKIKNMLFGSSTERRARK